MGTLGRQLAGERARATAEARVVRVGAVARPHDQLAVCEERIVHTSRVHIHACKITPLIVNVLDLRCLRVSLPLITYLTSDGDAGGAVCYGELVGYLALVAPRVGCFSLSYHQCIVIC